jgi:hypothetical protein
MMGPDLRGSSKGIANVHFAHENTWVTPSARTGGSEWPTARRGSKDSAVRLVLKRSCESAMIIKQPIAQKLCDFRFRNSSPYANAKILGFDSGVTCFILWIFFLDYGVVWTRMYVPTFLRNVLSSSSSLEAWRWKNYSFPEGGYLPTGLHGVTFPKNDVDNLHRSINVTSHIIITLRTLLFRIF